MIWILFQNLNKLTNTFLTELLSVALILKYETYRDTNVSLQVKLLTRMYDELHVTRSTREIGFNFKENFIKFT